jgi:hypothetical protein
MGTAAGIASGRLPSSLAANFEARAFSIRFDILPRFLRQIRFEIRSKINLKTRVLGVNR